MERTTRIPFLSRPTERPAPPTRPVKARATRHEQRDVVAGGVRLRYIDVGPTERAAASGTPVLLIHGLSSRIEEYDTLVPHLARHHRVIVPDLPGSGYSDKPDRPYTLTSCEDALLGLLDASQIASAATSRCASATASPIASGRSPRGRPPAPGSRSPSPRG
jgi:alpha/beta hydrolase fold